MKLEQLFQKIQEITKIKVNKRIEFNGMEGCTYPDKDICENKQLIWLDKKNFIEVEYINDDKRLESIKLAEDHMKYIFQKIGDKDNSIIRIKFRKDQIHEGIETLLLIIIHNNAERDEFKITLNDADLGIIPMQCYSSLKPNEKVLYGEMGIVDESVLLECIKNNLREENKIDIILEDYYSHTFSSGVSIWCESEDYEDGYLAWLETERIRKIKEKNNIDW